MGLPRQTRRATLLALAALVASGCFTARHRGDGEPPDAGDDVVEAFLAARDREICRRAIECEPRVHGDPGAEWICTMPGSPDEHRQWREGVLRFDDARASRCLERLRSGSGCFDDDDHLADCIYDVFAGALPEGAACDWHDVCAPDLMCERCVCVPAPRLGEACDRGACVRDAICDRETFQCVPPPGLGSSCHYDRDCGPAAPFCRGDVCREDPRFIVGEPCSRGFDCGDDLMCDFLAGLVCAERRAAGEPCISSADCATELGCFGSRCGPAATAGEPCDEHGDCNESAPFCVGEGEIGACSADPTGAACWPAYAPDLLVIDEPDRVCPEGFACVPPEDDGSYRGRCEARVDLGERCVAHAVCPPRSRCVDGTCVGIVLPDEPCGPSAVCPLTHVCEDGRCTIAPELPDLGEPCDPALGCRVGLCMEGVCARLGRPEGSPCESYWECAGICEEGRCQAVAREGERCEHPIACEEGTRCTFRSAELVCERACEAL